MPVTSLLCPEEEGNLMVIYIYYSSRDAHPFKYNPALYSYDEMNPLISTLYKRLLATMNKGTTQCQSSTLPEMRIVQVRVTRDRDNRFYTLLTSWDLMARVSFY